IGNQSQGYRELGRYTRSGLETSTIAPVISSVAPVVETTLVASPTGLCGLVPYTGSDSDSPDEVSSPEHISLLPATSPFICTDSSEAPDSSDGHLLPVHLWILRQFILWVWIRQIRLIRDLQLEMYHPD
ncbi:hypothetical protein Tco_0330744, partial [Tanacetum coccineum]